MPRCAARAAARASAIDVLQHVDVFEEPPAALVGEPAEGLRALVVEALPDLDEPLLVEHLEVPAEVAVGQGAEVLQVGEEEALGVGRRARS